MSRPSRAGLPSGPGPRSRSRSAVRARYDDDQRDDSRARRRYDDDARVPGRNSDDSRARRYDDDSQSRQVRPQRSMASISQGRSGSQPALPIPSSRSRHVSSDTRSESSTNRSSDSTTSSASSFLDRMKGYASSRTSLEDVEPPKPSTRSMRSRPSRAETPPPEDDAPGDGYTLWSRVASAASSLTVNVGKAWASNITTFAGEETPVGQESRLTRAMKAYHLEKARDPSDLPPWLFDENERRRPAAEPTRSRRRHDDYDDVDERPMSQAEAASATRGLRDIYDAAASKSSRVDRSMRGARSYADDSPQPSKATDRLKALRDAKRSAVNPGVVKEEPRAERDREPEPRRRVGLPSGPVSRRV